MDRDHLTRHYESSLSQNACTPVKIPTRSRAGVKKVALWAAMAMPPRKTIRESSHSMLHATVNVGLVNMHSHTPRNRSATCFYDFYLCVNQ